MDDPGTAQPVPLGSPRALTQKERAIIDFLVNGPSGSPALCALAEAVEVVATCSCGCPSVWLTGSLEDRDRQDDNGSGHVALRATQRGARESTEVSLHVVGGRLFELEIFGGTKPDVDPTRLVHVAP